MMCNWKRVVRPATPEDRERHGEIREKVKEEFPPRDPPTLQPATDGLGALVRAAREAQGLTRYALAERAGISDPRTVRDIEYGRDAKLSDVQLIAKTLDLELTLVESVS